MSLVRQANAFVTAACLVCLACVSPQRAEAQTQQATTGTSAGDFDTPSINSVTGDRSGGFGSINPYSVPQKHWIVEGLVKDLGGNPVSGAKVVVEPLNGGAEEHPLHTDIQGRFYTEYWLNADQTKELRVSLVATKKGYPKAHEAVQFANSEKPWAILITLRDPHPDPDLLSQEDLVFTLLPRLKALGEPDGLSAKSEKDYEHGMEEMQIRNRPEHAVPWFIKIVERDPDCVQCRTLLALADLESGDWDSASRDIGEAVNATLKNRKIGRPEPLFFYGVMESWRHETDQAAAYFVEALKFAPQDPLALQELGRTQLLLQNWTMADSYLAKALAAGAGPESRLMRVEALLNQGDLPQAGSEMTRYLDGRNVEKMPLRVRQLYLQVKDKKTVQAVYRKPKSKSGYHVDYLRETPSDLAGLEAAASQDPLDSILSGVGKNVADYFKNFPNTSSLEQIHQEKLRKNDKSTGALDQKFHYLCLAPVEAFGPGFKEYRVNLSDEQGQPQGLTDGFMLTSGFASASLIFHPAYQSQAAFRYVGRQKIDGRDTFVVAFAQRPEKARVNGAFKSGDVTMTTFSQGLAWVDADKYQIVRLRTDLLSPLPEVRLERETTEINFGETRFKGMTDGFWLPRQVSVAVDWNGKHLRNQHQYSDFRLFNVGSTQKLGKLKNVKAEASDQN